MRFTVRRNTCEQAAELLVSQIKPALGVFAEALSGDFSGVVEAIISPHSSFVGKTLMEVRFRHNHLMAPLSIVHQGQIHYQRLGSRVLESGDVILMHGKWESFQRMRPKRDLLFAQPLHHEVPLTNKAWAAIGLLRLGHCAGYIYSIADFGMPHGRRAGHDPDQGAQYR